MMRIPPQLNEAVDGFLLVMLLFTTGYFVFYLFREFRTRRNWRAFHNSENNAAIALLTIMLGLLMKNGAEWWWFHLHNKGQVSQWPILVPMLVGGTLISVWGLICLLRTLARHDWPRWVWALLTLIAVAFGIFFTLYGP